MTKTGQIKTKLMDVIDSIGTLDQTPTAFRWTPAMAAIWPSSYRPTMSGLLAIWEAMHEAAQYDTPQPVAGEDGWIEWGGGECPTIPNMVVDVRLNNGGIFQDMAGQYRWGHHGLWHDIIAYRVVK